MRLLSTTTLTRKASTDPIKTNLDMHVSRPSQFFTAASLAMYISLSLHQCDPSSSWEDVISPKQVTPLQSSSSMQSEGN